MSQLPLVPILSATLEEDDVALAKHWLAMPRQAWNDVDVVSEWESTFAEWLGVSTATAWMGGRASLYAAVKALELREGDEVILPAFTCQCVINAFHYQGIVTKYADIESATYGFDLYAVEKVITPKTKAILLQYTFGLVSQHIAALLQLAKQHNLYVIEDCAHALGAKWKGQKLGTFGDVAIFSTERSKIINTIHGGLVTTNNREIGQRLIVLKNSAPMASVEKTEKLLNTVIHNHLIYNTAEGQLNQVEINEQFSDTILPQMFPEEFVGEFIPHYTEVISPPIAALALNQFKKLPRFHERRLKSAKYWFDWCIQKGITAPLVIADSEPSFLRFPICVSPERKNDLKWIEDELKVTVGVWFTSAAHPTPIELDDCPVGTKIAKACINLPTLLPDAYLEK